MKLSIDFDKVHCNFYYSLLGIETIRQKAEAISWKLQFLLLPIRDWNFDVRLGKEQATTLQFLLLPIRDWNKQGDIIGRVGSTIAISITPY